MKEAGEGDSFMIEEWLQRVQIEDYPWLWQVFFAVLATALINYLVAKFLARLTEKLARTHTVWDDALLAAVRKPMYWMIWLVGFSYVLQLIVQTSDAQIFAILNSLRAVM
ncbi:MAG TPA: hypothetical protein DIW43_07025, partial [Spongiibacteraceae bacterium]|nr:hypothetical protein [Spongiibacteraceae bacterium]